MHPFKYGVAALYNEKKMKKKKQRFSIIPFHFHFWICILLFLFIHSKDNMNYYHQRLEGLEAEWKREKSENRKSFEEARKEMQKMQEDLRSLEQKFLEQTTSITPPLTSPIQQDVNMQTEHFYYTGEKSFLNKSLIWK